MAQFLVPGLASFLGWHEPPAAGLRTNLDYRLCFLQMKPPQPTASPLLDSGGGPSPALWRAAEAWTADERGTQIAAVLATVNRQPPRFVLLATESQEATNSLPVGAVLCECLPGRAAVVMTPQITSTLPVAEQAPIATRLLLGLAEILRAQGMLLAQALTATPVDSASLVFLAAGYHIAGQLLYLGASLDDIRAERPPGTPLPFELVQHSPDDEGRWIRLIDQTYLGTLDCPAVDGLRPTRDVLAGYRDIGEPGQGLWFIARHEGRDVACLILASHRPARHIELVYMGLIPAFRGRGWGVFLAQQALRLAADNGAESVVLSVDAANTPALRHYQAAGFRSWETRTILIKSLAVE